MALASSDQFALYRPTDALNYKTSLDDITSFIQATTASTLQEVTDNGSDTTNTILINKSDGADNALTVQSAGTQTAAIAGSGTIQTGGNAENGGAQGARLCSFGAIDVTRTNASDYVWAGYTEGSSTTTSSITANGNCWFSGQITSGNATGGLNTDGVSLSPGGAIFIGQSNDIELSFSIFDTASSAYTVSMLGNGTAEFATTAIAGTDPGSNNGNGAKIHKNGYVAARPQADGDQIWFGFNDVGGDDTSAIYGDGSATFAGKMQVTNRIEGYAPSNGDYALVGYGFGSAGASYCLRCNDSGGTEVASILDNGAATFAGQVAAQNILCDRDTGSYKLWIGQLNSSNTSEILADGTATFNGRVVSGSDPYTGTGNVGVRIDNGGFINVRSAGSNPLWTGQATGSGDVTSSIKADGDASFAGTLSAGTIANTVPLDSWAAIPPLT